MATHISILAWKIPMDYSHKELDMTEHLSTQGNHENKTLRSRVQSSNCQSSCQWSELYCCVCTETMFLKDFCCSVTKSCLTLCDPMDCSMPSFSVLHYLPEFAQTHVHSVSHAIQPSHPLLSSSPPAFNISQHQGLFQWVGFFSSGGQNIGASVLASPSNEYSGLISLN